MRPRPAPSASRTAILAPPRAAAPSSRLATLAQTIASTTRAAAAKDAEAPDGTKTTTPSLRLSAKNRGSASGGARRRTRRANRTAERICLLRRRGDRHAVAQPARSNVPPRRLFGTGATGDVEIERVRATHARRQHADDRGTGGRRETCLASTVEPIFARGIAPKYFCHVSKLRTATRGSRLVRAAIVRRPSR